MTYRQLYAESHGEEAAKTVHIDNCPNDFLDLIRDGQDFECLGLHNDGSADCNRCWDTEVPVQTTPAVPDDTITVTVTGEEIHVTCEGSPADLMQGVLAAVHYVAADLYAAGKDWKSGEELVHIMQQALAPTSKLWDFSEGGKANE